MPRLAQHALILATALGLLLSGGQANAQAPMALSSVALNVPGARDFGGLSAIEITRNGSEAIVLSDRGALFVVRLARSNGQVTVVDVAGQSTLTDGTGQPMPQARSDAEGLAILPDGRIAISFENRGDIGVHAPNGREAALFSPVPSAENLPVNGGFEGLAADALGRLYTLPEDMPGTGPIPLFRHAAGTWTQFATIPRDGRWRPVGLDVDDQGRLYVLERRFSFLSFGTRLTRYALQTNGLGPGQLVLQTPMGQHGNLEGVSIWRNGQGQLVASMVSDDNFQSILETTLVEYVLPN